MSVRYTDPSLVTDAKRTLMPNNNGTHRGKIPTSAMVRYLGRWRRVWSMQYGNAGSAYIIVGGEDLFLDIDTEHRLSEVALPTQQNNLPRCDDCEYEAVHTDGGMFVFWRLREPCSRHYVPGVTYPAEQEGQS